MPRRCSLGEAKRSTRPMQPTVGRILKEPPADPLLQGGVVQVSPALPGDDNSTSAEGVEPDKKPEIVAKYPGHLWHIDLTVVPTADGLAAPWHPFALHQTWPFCWWVALVVDHFSRCAMWPWTQRTPSRRTRKRWLQSFGSRTYASSLAQCGLNSAVTAKLEYQRVPDGTRGTLAFRCDGRNVLTSKDLHPAVIVKGSEDMPTSRLGDA